MKKPNLFLDDIRFPHEVTWGNLNGIYQNLEWDIVRNYDEFVSYIQENGVPDGYISFDHDLAQIHYSKPVDFSDISITKESDIWFVHIIEKTGLDCAKFFVEYCLYHDIKLPKCLVHSMNPVGRENILQELISYYKRRFS